MRVGIACDLRSAQSADSEAPDDALEEYDTEETVDAISAALRHAGHEPVMLGGGRSFLERAPTSRADIVFNIAEGSGSRSREAHVPAACEMLGLRYTGSDPLTLALCLDKAMTKRVLLGAGIETASFCTISSTSDFDHASLPPFPAIAKLNAEGSSIGVHPDARATTLAQLEAGVTRLLHDYRAPVIIEHFIGGMELTVTIFGTGGTARVTGTMEVAPAVAEDTPFVYSIDAKRNYRELVEYHVPPRLTLDALTRVEQCALAAYRTVGCRDVGRVDVRLDDAGVPFVIEINPLPGLHPGDSDLAMLWRLQGVSYDTQVARILDVALERCGTA